MRWTAPACVYRGSDVIFYTCELNDLQSHTSVEFKTENTSVEIDRLKPFRKYTLVVAIDNDAGAGPSTSPLTFQTLEDGNVFMMITVTLNRYTISNHLYITS